MNKLVIILSILTLLGVMIVAFPESVGAILVLLVTSFIALAVIRRFDRDNSFLIDIFLVALIFRVALGTIIHLFELREFFGGDALAYDTNGERLVALWLGTASPSDLLSQIASSTSRPGWGMNYLTGGIYFLVGHNILAAQFFCAVIGAATAPLVYFFSYSIFENQRVGKISALLVALTPGFVIWSSQLLKDGLIIFLLVLSLTAVSRLQKKFNYLSLATLILSLFAILSLRFYIFYIVAIAVAISFIVGTRSSAKAIVRSFIALAVIGVALTYLGVLQTAEKEFERYGTLERVQISRQYLSSSAESGYIEGGDVTTTGGALIELPVGFIYLMFAPFPWQVSNFRQSIALPEMMLWWAAIPLLLSGLLYTVKNRLRSAIPILIFTMLLTIGYSVFQGNVGTAYRQRAQIQVFLFIFIAVGWTLWQERKENRKIMRDSGRKRLK